MVIKFKKKYVKIIDRIYCAQSSGFTYLTKNVHLYILILVYIMFTNVQNVLVRGNFCGEGDNNNFLTLNMSMP